MYIITNDQTYPEIRVLSTSRSVRLLGASLTGLTELTGPVTVYADNGFELRTITPSNYLRQEIADGSWLLTDVPVPPVVATPVAYDLLTSTANMTKLLIRRMEAGQARRRRYLFCRWGHMGMLPELR